MRKILILAIVVPSIIAGWSSWVIADSYDFEPSTTNNPLHVEARVVYGTQLLMTCPEKPCSPPHVFQLRYYSPTPMQLVGYNICDGFSCVKNGGFATYTITRAGLSGHPEHWAGASIGDVYWQVGDTVHIRVKVKPVTIAENG